MNDLIKTHENGNGDLLVSGRDLHGFLEVDSNYTTWFKRMSEYGFVESVDYNSCFPNLESENKHGGHNKVEHSLTISMAKEICMLQRTDKGKQARQYFLQLEQAWNTPAMVMARALKMADRTIDDLKMVNATLIVKNAIMAPKAEYFDDMVDRNLLTNFRDTAKELKVPQNKFIDLLLEKKYIYRDKKGKIKPYAGHEDLMEIKETMNDKTGWAGTQTLITPKGRETFRSLFI